MIGALIPLLFSFTLVSDVSTVNVGYPYQVSCEMDLLLPTTSVYTNDGYLVSTYFDGNISCDMYCNEESNYLLSNFTLNGQLIYNDGLYNDDYIAVYYQDGHTFNGITDLDRYYAIHTYAETDYYYFEFDCGNQTPLSIENDFGYASFLAWNDYTIYFESSLLLDNINNYISTLIRSTQTIYDNGYTNGFNTGYESGYTVGYDEGSGFGYQTGFNDGFTDAYNQDTTAATIFTGILEVGLLPINVFLLIFNYEVFGINISGLVSGLLTIAVVLIIIRLILSKSGGNGGSSKS